MSTILYSFIAQNDSVIADYATPQIYNSDKSVNLDLIARNNLSKIPKNNSNGFNVILGHYFFHHVKNGLVLSCVTSSDENTDLPKKFLVERFHNSAQNEYNNTNMKLKSIESSLIYTTDTLRENITNIMERGELIDSIVTKSDNLKRESRLFRDSVKSASLLYSSTSLSFQNRTD
eukprot:XP_763163.1 hypothetical protein [Theileria parva strain Muguga]